MTAVSSNYSTDPLSNRPNYDRNKKAEEEVGPIGAVVNAADAVVDEISDLGKALYRATVKDAELVGEAVVDAAQATGHAMNVAYQATVNGLSATADTLEDGVSGVFSLIDDGVGAVAGYAVDTFRSTGAFLDVVA